MKVGPSVISLKKRRRKKRNETGSCLMRNKVSLCSDKDTFYLFKTNGILKMFFLVFQIWRVMEAESMMTKAIGGASTPAAGSGAGSQQNSSSGSSNGVFSPSAFLPPARRCWNGPFNNNNGTAEDAAAAAGCSGFQTTLTAGPAVSLQQQQQRKRPCCHHQFVVDKQEDYEDAACKPLDLSLPKFKVRQHWSGGSIVHESTFSLPSKIYLFPFQTLEIVDGLLLNSTFNLLYSTMTKERKWSGPILTGPFLFGLFGLL